jgi:hypothetical protein
MEFTLRGEQVKEYWGALEYDGMHLRETGWMDVTLSEQVPIVRSLAR